MNYVLRECDILVSRVCVYLIFHSFKWHSPVMVGKRNRLTMKKYIRQNLTFIFLFLTCTYTYRTPGLPWWLKW